MEIFLMDQPTSLQNTITQLNQFTVSKVQTGKEVQRKKMLLQRKVRSAFCFKFTKKVIKKGKNRKTWFGISAP